MTQAEFRTCRSNHIKLLQGKLKHAIEVIEKLEKKINAHSDYLQAVEQVNRGKKKKVSKSLKPKYPDACPMRCAHHLTLYRQAKVKLHQKKRYAHKLRLYIAQSKTSAVHINLGNKYTVEMIGSKDESYGNQICQLDLIGKELHIRVPYGLEKRYGTYIQFPIRLPKHGTSLLATAWYNRQALTYRFIQKNPTEWEIHITIKFMSTYGMNSATAAAFVLARRGMFLSERLPARTAYQGMEPKKHTWSHWQSVAKRAKGSSRHSFYQPRLTVYSLVTLSTERGIMG